MIEFVYVFCGLILPAFYIPQIIKLSKDQTKLAGYSIGKAISQFLLRIPALIFTIFIIKHPLMNLVVVLDVLGRGIELGVALIAMRRQGVSIKSIALGWLRAMHPIAFGWRRFAAMAVASGSLAVFVAHAIENTEETTPAPTYAVPEPGTGGFLDSQ